MPPFSRAQPAPTSPPATGDPLLDEALALHDLLRHALHRATQLVLALKQEKRTRRALTSALGSLRKLEPWPPPSA
ncbi:MAG: hypothetical protein JNM56_09130 [Planctomycetia bacterium]|nr:hypothetical protein [Planctomycetia bacterium]